MIVIAFLLILVLIALGFHVAAAIGLLALFLSEFFAFNSMVPALGDVSWSASADFILVAIPMFIMMGQLLLHSGVAQDMYRGLSKWLNWIPGGLMHTNVASCAMFAATSGSSVATAATIGTMAIPNIKERKYHGPLFLGTLAGGGTLGILIPPSIPLIVYGVLSETSVVKLYLAAMIPGIMLATLFSLIVFVLCLRRSEWGGVKETATWGERIRALPLILPPVGLFLLVVGSIYAGIATPTEAAAMGLLASFLIAASRRMLTKEIMIETFISTMRTTCMTFLILIMAFFLNVVLVSTGVTHQLVSVVGGLDWPPVAVFFAIIVFYLILGCFMETLSILVATTPIIVPIVIGLGYDPIWFGIVFMILIESAMLTPPIGINLYVIQSIRKGGPFGDVVRGSLPFLAMMLMAIVILMIFPQLALYLPSIGAG